jgi:hypothetical protein
MPTPPKVAQVDQVIDENGQPLALPEDSALVIAHNVEETLGGTGPTNWWRYGLIGFVIVVAMLLLFQLLLGRTSTPTPPAAAPATTQQ